LPSFKVLDNLSVRCPQLTRKRIDGLFFIVGNQMQPLCCVRQRAGGHSQ
jgi:hypothetical protein